MRPQRQSPRPQTEKKSTNIYKLHNHHFICEAYKTNSCVPSTHMKTGYNHGSPKQACPPNPTNRSILQLSMCTPWLSLFFKFIQTKSWKIYTLWSAVLFLGERWLLAQYLICFILLIYSYYCVKMACSFSLYGSLYNKHILPLMSIEIIFLRWATILLIRLPWYVLSLYITWVSAYFISVEYYIPRSWTAGSLNLHVFYNVNLRLRFLTFFFLEKIKHSLYSKKNFF